MKALMRWLSAVLLVLIGVRAAPGEPLGVPDQLWRAALQGILLDTTDIRFRNDYVQIDPARLDVVDAAMRDPGALPEWLSRLAHASRLDQFTLGDAAYRRVVALEAPAPWRWADMRTTPKGLTPARPQDPVARAFPRVCAPILAALETLNRSHAPGTGGPSIMASVPDSIRTFLTVNVPELLWEEPDEEFMSADWQDSMQQAEEEIARRLVPLVEQIPRAEIWRDGLFLAGHFAASVAGLAPGVFRDSENTHEMMEWETEFGRVALGTSGPDCYRGRYAFIFDPGGDDTYELEYDREFPNRVILDLDGDDSYKGGTDAALAGGFWGTQILFDRRGDDTYRARRLDLGAGFFGWGLLIDAEGNDIYAGDTFVQGAGAFGYGALIDSAGNDMYSGALFAQGFGFVGGVGVLCDVEGNDHYNAGGRYKDVLRYVDRYLSLSQGFAYGIRPFLSGGVGLLLDRTGNDDYQCDIFGQGASYWWGLGALWDGAGNDRYLAFQYAQGSATHMTAAVLVDEQGDDFYLSKGVSQGCGHDLAPGLLWDLAGDDLYTAYDLSQGAGSANGLGLLFDAHGDDRYYVKSRLNTQGYGNPRRDYGSIGLFLDGGGHDRYDGPGHDGSWWRIESKWGIGIDWDEADTLR